MRTLSPSCLPAYLRLSLSQMASATDARYGQKESSDQNFDYMFKILIIGNSSVGKTSFLFRYADDSFTPAFVSTVGIDFKVKTIYRNDKRIKLQIWVRAGSCVVLFARRVQLYYHLVTRGWVLGRGGRRSLGDQPVLGMVQDPMFDSWHRRLKEPQ